VKRASLGMLTAAGALALLASPATAHPLGNFTINHYSGIRVAIDSVLVDHVIDMAEIPTFSERAAMDVDGDGTVSVAEASAYQTASCQTTAGQLRLTAAGRSVALAPVETGLSFPQGQGAPTLRLVCVLRAGFGTPVPLAGLALSFTDPTYGQRVGWREIVVEGDGTRISDSGAPSAGMSARLTSYPTDLLATPSHQSSAAWFATPGGAALPPFSVPDAQPIGSDLHTNQQVGPGAIPNGITDLGGDVAALFQARELTVPIVLLSLLAAAALGALHALSPGHGKTVMAAYLVGSRGSARHAVALGLTVTVSHTLGVVALAGLSLSAASIIPPERLYPILGLASGALVVAIGLWLVATRLRAYRQERAAQRAHDRAHAHNLAHAHGLEHERPHAHGMEHERPDEHGLEHERPDEHGLEHAPDADGWHSHGGLRHTHVPTGGQPLRWRGLFALGLAGGMVPSVSALILLLGSLSAGRPAYGLVLTVAFGIGMALVLVGIGMGLVYARGFVQRIPVGGVGTRMSRAMPAVTALVVLVAGVLITTQAALTL
jgi:nickel/cobalt exporter